MNEENSTNQAFIIKLTEIILANLEKEHFGVNELAREAGMTSSALRRKLRKVSKKSINQLIREVRLEKSMQILRTENATASEVAYKTGFGSPAYFNKCFHDYYGFPPGEVKNNKFDNLESNNKSIQPFIGVDTKNTIQKKKRRVVIYLFISIIIISIALFSFYNKLPFLNGGSLSGNKYSNIEKSIAALPFKNLSEEKENQYFADGVMEDILKLLYRIDEFRVVSRTSVEQYRESNKTIAQISKELGVNFILEGSVQRQKNMVRVNVRLIDARYDRQIFSDEYDKEFADIFNIQSSIAIQVGEQLEAVLSPNELENINKIPTKNTEAYNLYLKGRYFWNRRTEEGVRKSIKYFREAVEIDPSYALAWSGLADGYQILSGYGWYTPQEEGLDKAKRYTIKALELDNNLAEAHTTLGLILAYEQWKWKEAEEELEMALKLDPNYAFAHQIYAQWLDATGDFKKARKEIDIAIKLDPLSPVIHRQSATLYYNEGNLNKVIMECQEALSIEKNYIGAPWWIFYSYCRLENGDKALSEFKLILSLYNKPSAFHIKADNIYKKSGLYGLINLAIEIFPNKAQLYTLSGKTDEALTCLETYLIDNPGDALIRLINNYNYKTLRSEPRFKAVIDSLGLTEYYLKRTKHPGYIIDK